MKKLLMLLLLSTPCYAGLITHTDYTSGNTITASGQNANENTIVNEFNGNIDNTNIKSGAAIAVNKLAAGTANKLSITDNSGFISTADNSITSGSSITITGLTTFSSITFSPSTRGILGTTAGDNANVGVVGEYISSVAASGFALNAANSTHWKDMLSITLTPGDWDINAMAAWNYNAGVATTFFIAISSTSGDSGAGLAFGINEVSVGYAAAASNTNDITMSINNIRFTPTTTTTYYLKFNATYGSGTPRTDEGILQARRIR